MVPQHVWIGISNGMPDEKVAGLVKSVQSTLSHLITTSVSHATFTRFFVEHELFQYYS